MDEEYKLEPMGSPPPAEFARDKREARSSRQNAIVLLGRRSRRWTVVVCVALIAAGITELTGYADLGNLIPGIVCLVAALIIFFTTTKHIE